MKPAKKTKPGPAAGLRAVILAGGKGVRLHPFTVNFPKPLVPLGDKPVLEVLMERLLAFGISLMLGLQVFVNIAMNMGLAPVVGLPLPLLSYGGSSERTTFVALGILANIDKTRGVF